MSSGKISKPKNRYKNYIKGNGNKSRDLDVNFKGFLCTCNNREKDCVRESYNILNEAVHTLYGKDDPLKAEKNDEIDISDELTKEVEDLKTSKQNGKYKFNLYNSGAKNVLFIRTTYDNPVEIGEHIAKNIYESKQQQTKHLIRLVPIETTCKAYLDDILKAFEPLAEKYFKNEGKIFAISYNHRNNNSLVRDNVIEKIADKISSMRNDHKVNLKEPEVSVVIEVIRGFVLIGVVPNYFKYKKYNLLALSESIDEKCTDSNVSGLLSGV